MKARVKILSIVMGLVLLVGGTVNSYAAIVNGDDGCISGVGKSSITWTKVNSTTTEYKANAIINVKQKCVVNAYILDKRYAHQPTYAGKQHSFNGAINMANVSSNLHQNAPGLQSDFITYLWVFK